MKKKNAFTLAELLGVITLIGVIALLVVPIVDKAMKENKESLYQTQIRNIEKGARNWATENPFLMPEKIGESITITLGQLKQAGTVQLDIRDPKTKKLFPNNMLIEIEKNENGLQMTVNVESGSEDARVTYDPNAPTVILKGMATVYLEVNHTSGDHYIDPGVQAKTALGVSISEVSTTIQTNGTVVSNIPLNTMGKYIITYTARNGSLNTVITRTVIVQDTTPPAIAFPDSTELTVAQVATFDPRMDVVVSDNSGEVSLNVRSTVSNIPGIYTIIYEAIDQNNLVTKKQRTVIVKA